MYFENVQQAIVAGWGPMQTIYFAARETGQSIVSGQRYVEDYDSNSSSQESTIIPYSILWPIRG